MNYEVKTNLDGSVTLNLGHEKGVTFAADSTLNEVVAGTELLIELVVGVSAFNLVQAVADEFNKNNGFIDVEGNPIDNG